MSDFVKKRIEFVNNWPNSEMFEAEKNYKKRCADFSAQYNQSPFLPIRLWEDRDDTYNRTISHLIDSLEMMPLKPNFAFVFAFSGLDFYTKKQYTNNTTVSLKKLVEDIVALAEADSNIQDMLTELFSAIPISACLYLYKCLYGQSHHNTNVQKRVSSDSTSKDISSFLNIVEEIFKHFGYDSSTFNDSIRQGALLYRKAFTSENITISGNTIVMTNRFRLYLLLLGFIFSLRNDAFHGSSMSSTKSSKTTPKRYALNYYAFLTTYNLLMVALIMNSSLLQTEKKQRYADLKLNTTANIERFKNLFGSHAK